MAISFDPFQGRFPGPGRTDEEIDPVANRRARLGRLIHTLVGEELADALAHLAEATPDSELAATLQALSAEELQTDFSNHLLHRWSELAPEPATNWALACEGDEALRRRFLSIAGSAWSVRDLAGALAWLDREPETRNKDDLRAIFGEQALETQSGEALRLALELRENIPVRDFIATSAVARWTRAEPDAAAAWISRLPAGDFRDRLAVALTSVTAQTDGFAACAWALELLPPGPDQEQIVLKIVQGHPAAAVDWVACLPQELLQETSVPVVVTLWAANDATAAGAWINGLGLGTERDQAAAALAGTLAPRQPDIAQQWARTIQDPVLRARSMQGLQAWRQ